MIPKLALNNARSIPVLGLGTWKSEPGVVTQVVKDAIDIGYRHFDCAHIYGNEAEIGEAISEKVNSHLVARKDLYISSKLWNTFHSKESVRKSLQETLVNLKLKYLDLYMIHWPMGYKEGGDLFPKDANGKFMYSDCDYLETWKEMEECVKLGLTQSIGLSNFNHQQINRILSICSIVPSVLQVECHPYLNQSKLIEYCKGKGIVVTSYSPLGSPSRPMAVEGEPVIMEHPTLISLAKKYKKSPAQICIKFQLQRDICVIPKSVTKSRMESNFNVLDFELSDEELRSILALDRKVRLLNLNWVSDHPYYPFKEEF